MDKQISFQQMQPKGVLSDYIAAFWEATIDGNGFFDVSDQIIPYGFTEVGTRLSGETYTVLSNGERQLHPLSGIASFTDQHMLVEMNGPVHMFCLRLKPGVLFQLSGVSQTETANVVLQTNDVFGRGGREYSEQMQESNSFRERIELSAQFVMQQLARQKEEKKMIRQIAATILDKKGRVTVGELTDEFPLSERHLQREFKLQIGSTPKSFARMARFNHAFQIIKSSEKVDWQNVVFECGYFDQAHFIREFAAFTGKSPASFLAKQDANFTFWETMTGKVA